MNRERLKLAILVADLFCSVFAMIAALVWRYGKGWNDLHTPGAPALFPFLAGTWVIWTILSLRLPLDGFRGGWRFSAVISRLIVAVGTLMMALLSGGYLMRSYVSRSALVWYGALLLTELILVRAVVYWALRVRLARGSAHRVVIAGRGPLARELACKIQRHPEMLCRVVGFLAPDDGTADSCSSPSQGQTVSTGLLSVADLLSAEGIDEVILAPQECASPDLLKLVALCRAHGITISLVPDLYGLYLWHSDFINLDGLPVVQLRRVGLSGSALMAKRGLDLALGSVLLLFAVPLLLPFVLRLYLLKGEAFSWQTRCGVAGRPFAMLRLNIDRTPTNDSWLEDILRRFSLTELPQLWNVLRGEMSLVGPRPEPPERVCRYSEWQQQRLTAKPGMTGLAQVHGLREQHPSENKTRFDLQYLLHCSLYTDLSLLVQTIWTLATRSGCGEHPVREPGSAATKTTRGPAHVQEEICKPC